MWPETIHRITALAASQYWWYISIFTTIYSYFVIDWRVECVAGGLNGQGQIVPTLIVWYLCFRRLLPLYSSLAISPLSQRACQRDPCEHDPRHRSNDGCNCWTQWQQQQEIPQSFSGAKSCDFLTFLVLLSGITFELKLERTSFPPPPSPFYAPKEWL